MIWTANWSKFCIFERKKYLVAKLTLCQFGKKCVWKWTRNLLSLLGYFCFYGFSNNFFQGNWFFTVVKFNYYFGLWLIKHERQLGKLTVRWISKFCFSFFEGNWNEMLQESNIFIRMFRFQSLFRFVCTF